MAELSGSQSGRNDDLEGAVRGIQEGRNENLEGAVGGTRHETRHETRHINLQGKLMFMNER